MSKATSDLLATLDGLEEIAIGLGTAPMGADTERSKNILQLSGLHVIAFSALEDFLRRRAFEVIAAIGKYKVKFDDFPDSFRSFFLEETIGGVAYSLSRSDSKITFLQLQGLLLGSTGDTNADFEPSEYFFGRSQSNVSKAQIKDLLEALTVQDGWGSLAQIVAKAGITHLGTPDQIFLRLASNRHRAAHRFSNDYKITEFLTDMRSGVRVLSFAFDTCISQWGYQLKKAVENNQPFKAFDASSIVVRIVAFNPTSDKWSESRNGRHIKHIPRRDYDARFAHHKSHSAPVSGESIFIINGQGKVSTWLQPIS